MKVLFFSVFLLLYHWSWSQTINSSHTGISTIVNGKEISSFTSFSNLYYDEPKNAFYLQMDFTKLRVGVDSLDYWLDDLDDTYLYFKLPLQENRFPELSNNNTKSFDLKGELYFNKIWQRQDVELSIFNTDNSAINFSQTANIYKYYKVNFSFYIVPIDFNLHKKANQLTNTIFVTIGNGQINLLDSGMEDFDRDVYDH